MRTKTSDATCSCTLLAFKRILWFERRIRSIIMARETLNGPTPMDVSAVYKGKKGKGKSDDKGKEKDPRSEP